MPNYRVLGQNVSISNRELDPFRGVSRGGVLIVEIGEGPFDLKVTSWSSSGFDRSPNTADLVALMQRGLFTPVEVSGRFQMALTPLGKAMAERMGCYSLGCLVRTADEPVEEEVEPEAEYKPFTIDDPEETPQIAVETERPSLLENETLTDLAAVEDQDGDPEEEPSEPAEEPDGDPEPEVVEEPETVELPPADAKLKVLQAFADEHGISHEGMRSKKAVRAAIEAHFEG